jgi:hypothetical protein
VTRRYAEPEKLTDAEAMKKALRELQKFAETDAHDDPDPGYVIEAMDYLGEQLELKCTGQYVGWGAYDHRGDGSCPVHQWLHPSDRVEVDVRRFGP